MRHPIILLLLGSLLTGLGFICFLPPFEGFDETAGFGQSRLLGCVETSHVADEAHPGPELILVSHRARVVQPVVKVGGGA